MPARLILASTAILILALFATCACLADLPLARGGKPLARIIIDVNASKPVANAAAELKTYLGKVTGAAFETTGAPADGDYLTRIFVGRSPEVDEIIPGFDWASLKQDGIVIKTVGQDLILAGGEPRGTLNAVHAFLEDTVGIRWWTAESEYVPRKPNLSIPALNTVYTPQFAYRETFWQPVASDKNPEFCTRLKLNGHFNAIPADLGGHYTILGWCHTFFQLLPPSEYFAAHPEWYSEIGGRRIAENAQLCLTNEEMRKELVRKALEWIKANPSAGFISIAQNDCGGACQCVNCKAIADREGAQSGPLITFVNKVAEDIEKQYPNFYVETLAYQYTRRAPKFVRPRKNVLVRLCSIECDFSRPLDAPSNTTFYQDLKDWSAISPQLFIWDYTPNFGNFLIPHPNWSTLAPNDRIFAANKVVGVFEQGDAYNKGTNFSNFKCWVLSHYLWDPSADPKKLSKAFLDGYYGPAGNYFGQYMQLMEDAIHRNNTRLPCGGPTYRALTLDVMNKATILFNKAAAAVKNDPELSRRVALERLTIDHTWLLCTHLDRFSKKSLYPKDYKEVARIFVEVSKATGNNFIGEDRLMPDDYLDQLLINGAKELSVYSGLPVNRRKATPPDTILKDLPPTDWLDIQDSSFWMANQGEWVDLVADPAASDGAAARMPGTHLEWAVQYHIDTATANKFKEPECFISIKCESKAKTGTAFSLGLYDPAVGQTISERTVTLSETNSAGYRAYSLGRHTLKPGMYFWVCPPNSKEVDGVFIDRIFLVK